MTRRYVASALFAEGPTDHRFLQGLLPRSIEALGSEFGYELLEVGPIRQLLMPQDAPAGRAERVTAAVVADEAAFHVLFIHADADGDPPAAHRDRVQPVIDALQAALGPAAREHVAVIPLQMTEAWALADLEALQSTLSTGSSRVELGLPATPAGLENERHPKALLDEVVRRARSGRRGRRQPTGASFLDVLGEGVSIEALRHLGAYRAFEQELQRAIARLGHMPPPA